MDKKLKKLVLIDGNAIIHRAYHALPPLTTKKGELVNAVYGFSSILLKVLNDLKPDYILASFDLAAPTFRHKEYKDYKATRVKAPDDLYAQIGRVKEVVRAFNIPIFEKEGFEADDVIGTMATQAEKNPEGIETIIVTGDLDTLQLVNPKVKIYALRRGMSDIVVYDEKAVEDRYGLKPEQMVDYKGLRGDPSDNIPGVKGIGEKTATELLKKYGTIENVYKNLAEIKGAVKDKLERDKSQAILSKHLSEIVLNVPLEIDLEKAVMKDFDRKKIIDLFQELNFFSLIKRVPDANLQADSNLRMKFESMNENSKEIKDFKLEIINFNNKEKINFLLAQENLAFVLKNSEEKIESIAFSWKTGRVNLIEYAKENKNIIKNILENKNIEKIGYDVKKDLKILVNNGIKLSGKINDIMLESYVLNPGGKTDLENMILEELGEEIEEKKQKGQLGLGIKNEDEENKIIGRKADYIFKLHQIFSEKISKISATQNKEKNIQTILKNIEIPLLPILAEMEMNGIKLNKIIFKGISETITKKIKSLEEKIYKLSGSEFNINSPKQLAEILFVKMKISTENIKKIKTGFSTGSSELEKLRKDNKIIEFIEEYRELFKLKTTYLDALPELVDGKSRLHTTFNQAVTATGRLSSSEPNLQNIPIKTDLGQILRTAFVAEEGWKLVSADYSQIDLRVVAHVSGDKKMMEAFLKGEDIHRATAAEINKVTPSQVTEKMRNSAKALNFGVIYGMSVFGFSQSAGIERDDAKKFIDAYMEKFSGIAQYMRDTKASAKKVGFVETEMGRRRNIPEINSPNFQVQNAAERMAINMPIQGLAADIVKIAMINVYDELIANNKDARPVKSPQSGVREAKFNGVKMLLQVHDEIILEVKENLADEVGEKIKTIMENAYKLKVPLVVDVKIGDNWGEI
jgi:DNA polymerase-1